LYEIGVTALPHVLSAGSIAAPPSDVTEQLVLQYHIDGCILLSVCDTKTGASALRAIRPGDRKFNRMLKAAAALKRVG
jgi:hypothetical protein